MNALYVLAFILFVLAAIVARTRWSGWWPTLACAGLALWVLAGPLGADID